MRNEWILRLDGVIFGTFGVLCLLWPHSMFAPLGLNLGPAATIEIRAMYGGLELGIAAWLFYASRRPDWVAGGLLLGGLSIGGLFGVRTLMLVLEAGSQPFLWKLAIAEAVGAALNFYAYRQCSGIVSRG